MPIFVVYLFITIIMMVLSKNLIFLTRSHRPQYVVLESHRKKLTNCTAVHCTVLMHVSLTVQSFNNHQIIKYSKSCIESS